MSSRWLLLLLLIEALAWPTRASAHALAPASLEIMELGVQGTRVSWRTSTIRFGPPLVPQLPAHCQNRIPPEASRTSSIIHVRWLFDCGAQGLAGERIAVDGLDANPVDVLVAYTPAQGDTVRTVLRAGEASLRLPEATRTAQVLATYLDLGFRHILSGFDHLLFLAALLLLVRRLRTLLWTVSGFTLGHSLTLSLAALGLAQAPAGTETMIALSILFVAREALRESDSLARRYPVVVAALFGLVHGMGMAGALIEIGLPSAAAVPALAAFNVGVELGQLLVVLGLVALWRVFARLAPSPLRLVRLPGAYAIGILAAFWTLERSYAALLPTTGA